jgi:hypothetical protein
MKEKLLLVSLMASTALMASDYGYREFLFDKNEKFISLDETTTVYANYAPAGDRVNIYCMIQGGNLSKTITTDLGTEELKAFDQKELAPLLAMTKEDRIAKYGKGTEKGELHYNDVFRATTMANRATGKYGIGGEFVCKDQSDKQLFSAYQTTGARMPGAHATIPPEFWIVKHKQEPIIDNVSFSAGLGHKESNMLGRTSHDGNSEVIKKKLNEQYPTYASYFDDWNNGFLDKSRKQKLNDNYRMSRSFNFDVSFWLNNSMGELSEVQYFCESKKGKFTKEGKPFRTFLKEFYNDGGKPDRSTFAGNYACTDTSEAFTLELGQYAATIESSFGLDYALIKKGASDISAKTPTNITQQPQIQQEKMDQARQLLNGMFGGTTASEQRPTRNSLAAKMGINMDDMNLVANAIATKAPFGTHQGANISTAIYNGKDSRGCDLVSIDKSVINMPNSKRTYNYKACNGQIIALGETGLPGVPRNQELDPIIAQVKAQCKAYGAYGTQYNNTLISCKALDLNYCNLEISIMQDNKLIEKRIEKTCK